MVKLKGLAADKFLRISAIGQNRPGIVHKLATIITHNDGNILLQRSITVGPAFAIIVVAAFDGSNLAALEEVKRTLSGGALGDDFAVLVNDTTIDDATPRAVPGSRYVINCVGDDRAGITVLITAEVLNYGISIDSMESLVTHQPVQGTTTFDSRFEFTAPIGFDMEPFEKALYQLQSDTDMKITIKPRS